VAPTPGAVEPPRQPIGLSSEPQGANVISRNVLNPPASPFSAWDGASVVLYDTQTDRETKMGRGGVAHPAFGGNYFVYVSDAEVWLVDLATMQRQSLGPGYVAYFLGDAHVVVNPGDNNFVVIEIATGNRVPVGELKDPLLKSMAQNRWGGAFRARWVDGRYAVRLAQDPAQACSQAGAGRDLCEARAAEEWIVEDVTTGQVLYMFRANKVEPAGPGEVVVATTPACRGHDNALVECYEVLAKLEQESPEAFIEGVSNIYIVNLESGEASFVASAAYNASARSWPMNWPLVADASFVAWTESYCGQPAGRTRVFDRTTAQLTELNVSAWLSLRNGELGFGEFGATAVFNPRTFQYTTVLPDLTDVSWSADMRWAAVGAAFGHGGLCG
jgi:DNA-binding beta-propeller fold protein YncE